ncbi:hypothetical protein [Erythrobacter ani]|uniref:Uncharacterized protein n=1 Tax=Erythrobacter ani TaxID=2827235 RepID=A0ABS6SRA8_9SPHN|nr:hypothetical protein [Erythrobacter ani]MBV7267525.1 hypothetical protein [Erythrobacter ani]
MPIDDARERLIESVSRTLNLTAPDDIVMLEEAIAAHLTAEGFHSLQGRTGKLRELMIWRSQAERTHTVDLPEGQVTTRVVYLDDFVSGGWSSYFTCNRAGTGGWAKPDALYVVVPRWESLEDERFQVSFLAHESQHFRDYRMFPDLMGWELEYRAKLVELNIAYESRDRLIARFEANQSDDPSDAHSFANRRVIAAMKRELKLPASASLAQASVEDVQIVAKRLLLDDSMARQEALLAEQPPVE